MIKGETYRRVKKYRDGVDPWNCNPMRDIGKLILANFILGAPGFGAYVVLLYVGLARAKAAAEAAILLK